MGPPNRTENCTPKFVFNDTVTFFLKKMQKENLTFKIKEKKNTLSVSEKDMILLRNCVIYIPSIIRYALVGWMDEMLWMRL